MSTSYGECGVQNSDKAAAMSSNRLSRAPIAKLGCPRARFQKPGALQQGRRRDREWQLMKRDAHISLAFTRGSMTAYSTSTTKLTITTMAASNITQLRTTIRSRLEIDWKISRPRPGR